MNIFDVSSLTYQVYSVELRGNVCQLDELAVFCVSPVFLAWAVNVGLVPLAHAKPTKGSH